MQWKRFKCKYWSKFVSNSDINLYFVALEPNTYCRCFCHQSLELNSNTKGNVSWKLFRGRRTSGLLTVQDDPVVVANFSR